MSNDAEIQAKYRADMQVLAETLDNFLNPHLPKGERTVGFVLLVFPFGQVPEDTKKCNYISNGKREDIVSMMHEMLARFEGQPETAPGHA